MPSRRHQEYIEHALLVGFTAEEAEQAIRDVRAEAGTQHVPDLYDRAMTRLRAPLADQRSDAARLLSERGMDQAPETVDAISTMLRQMGLRVGADGLPEPVGAASASTFTAMRGVWDGDQADILGMVRALAPTMASEEDFIRKSALTGPVRELLKRASGTWMDVRHMGDYMDLQGEYDVVPLVLCLDGLTDIGALEYDGDHSWRLPLAASSQDTPTEPAPEVGTDLFGREPVVRTSVPDAVQQLAPFMASHEQQQTAHALLEPLYTALRERPGQALALADLAPLVGRGPEDAIPLFIAMGYLVDDGKAVQEPAADGKGPRWRAA